MIANDAATGKNENEHKAQEHPMAQESSRPRRVRNKPNYLKDYAMN